MALGDVDSETIRPIIRDAFKRLQDDAEANGVTSFDTLLACLLYETFAVAAEEVDGIWSTGDVDRAFKLAHMYAMQVKRREPA